MVFKEQEGDVRGLFPQGCKRFVRAGDVIVLILKKWELLCEVAL